MAEHFRRKVREALSDEVRVDILRLLVREGRGGLPAGVIASDLEVLQNSIAAQLTVLLNAGLNRVRMPWATNFVPCRPRASAGSGARVTRGRSERSTRPGRALARCARMLRRVTLDGCCWLVL
jgi:hypothetical protein